MPETTETMRGQRAEEIVEAGAGGVYQRALTLLELDMALYVAENEFGYDEDDVAKPLTEAIKALRARVQSLSITEKGALTLDRVCDACGGDGRHWKFKGTPCEECAGAGFEHLEASPDA